MYFLFLYGEDWFIKNKYLYFENQKINLKKLSLLGDHQFQNLGCAIMICNKINNLKIETKLNPFSYSKYKMGRKAA